MFCVEHKWDGHVDLTRKTCKHPGCPYYPSLGPPAGTSKDVVYCAEHCPPGYVNLSNKRCFVCLVSAANRRYKEAACNVDICARCFVHQFPGHNLARVVRIKERLVADALRSALPGMHIVLDKRVHGGCSGRRPNVFIRVHT